MYFVANWKMFGDFKSLKLVNKVISFSKKFKSSKFKIIYLPPTPLTILAFTEPVSAP